MTQVSNIPYDDLQVGQKASFSSGVEERDVQLFAAVSRDHNPVHLDAEFAAKTMFKERIAHGMFSGALISAAIACEMPGPGTIYLGQQMRFTRPVKLGDTLTVELEVLENCPRAVCASLPGCSTSMPNKSSMAKPKCSPRAKNRQCNCPNCHRSPSAELIAGAVQPPNSAPASLLGSTA